VTKTDAGKVLSFTVEAFDAYTNKRIAAATGNSEPNNTAIVPVLLEQALLSKIDPFVNQLQQHFDDMLVNGREIRLTVKRWNTWQYTLEDEIAGEEITEHINNWMQTNTVNKRFNMSDASENIIRFEQVRIPIYDANGNPIDARAFAKGLQKHLKATPYNFEVKLVTRGLGEAILILGEK
jgi:sRNA-binding regulator protein Hfq